MPKQSTTRRKKRRFHGNRFTKETVSVDENLKTASSSKLDVAIGISGIPDEVKASGNRIFDLSILIAIIADLCCPVCLNPGLQLIEESKFGLSSSMSITCSCGYVRAFSTTPKHNKLNVINSLLVLGLRLIGKGFSSGRKLFYSLNLPFLSKAAFRRHELQLLSVVKSVASENMSKAAEEVITKKGNDCGVSVDGTWQRRGYSSLNGCVSAISIDTGKVLDLEVLSTHCRICSIDKNAPTHSCSNHQGSSSSMEPIGSFRMFERSIKNRKLRYTEYYGDGDSKGHEVVKDIYGKDSVKKLECIGHVQKRVGSRLRKLKKTTKGLGGKGKLTDSFINKLQNYYGIAIRSNSGNLQGMLSSVIAAFHHCCSNAKNSFHKQCPRGPESWCKFQRAEHFKTPLVDKSPGLPESIMKVVRPIYMSLCDTSLLSKCLHGMTQNNNESLNNIIWSIVPKETFVELQTLTLGSNIAVLLFNSGLLGLLPVYKKLNIQINQEMLEHYKFIDNERINASRRQSLDVVKIGRKRKRGLKKSKLEKYELKEGLTYKSGEF